MSIRSLFLFLFISSFTSAGYSQSVISKDKWVFYKAVPIGKNSICNDSKFASLNMALSGEQVFINDKHTDDIYLTTVKTASYFEHAYMLRFYQDMIPKNFGFKLGEKVLTLRNKKAGDASSVLNSYFNDAFITNSYLFTEAGGCVMVYRKLPNKAGSHKQTTSGERFVTLPFDVDEYYKACVYPVDTRLCGVKYPNYPFKVGSALYNEVKKVLKKEPDVYFKIPHAKFSVMLIHFQGDENDEYHLVAFDNNKIVDSIEVGSTGGSLIKDFIITESRIDIFVRKVTDQDKKHFKSYRITSEGQFAVVA